jgi:protein O-mannosyl-transferase
VFPWLGLEGELPVVGIFARFDRHPKRPPTLLVDRRVRSIDLPAAAGVDFRVVQARDNWGVRLRAAGRALYRGHRLAVASLAVAAAAFFTYAKVLGFGFIYDDYWTVVGNKHLEKPLGELVRAALTGRSIEWDMPDATRPLMGVSLWVDRRLFGLSPAGYHLHSALLYALVSVLVLWLAFGVLRRFQAALFAALAFAVAPLHVEVASAVNYREDLIAALGWFGAAALCFWPMRRERRWQGLGCGALWAYALLGKESAFMAPLFVLALALSRRPPIWRKGARAPLAFGGAAVAAIWLEWRLGLSKLGEQVPTAHYASYGERLLRTARFEVLGVWKSFVPIAPRPEHEPLGPAHWAWALALLLVLATIAVLWRRRRTRVLAAAGLVALVSPLCTSPFVAPLNEIGDRYWFVGSFAAALGVGWIATRFASRRARWALVALLCSCSIASWKASSVWASEVDLWTFVAQTAPTSARAWTALSRVHRLADQEMLAERAVDRALALRPNYLPARTARVLNLTWFGDLAGARRALAAIDADERVHGDSLGAARRCAGAADAEAARACARRSVPVGLVLGDPERLRAIAEQLLSAVPNAPPPMGEVPPRRDAGVDVQGQVGEH